MHRRLEPDWKTPAGQEQAGSNQRFQTDRQSWMAEEVIAAAADRQRHPLYPRDVCTQKLLQRVHRQIIL